MLCGTSNIMWNSSTSRLNVEIFRIILSIPKNNVMDMNNFMTYDIQYFMVFYVTNYEQVIKYCHG